MWLGAVVYIHFTLLAYASEQICMPHYTYLSHCTTTVIYIRTADIALKNLQLLFTMLLPYMCQQVFPSNAKYMPHIKSVHVHMQDNYNSIYTSYKLTAISNMARNTCIHTVHIIGICPGTNMPATLHMSVPLHVYYTVHKDPILLHILVK